MALKSDVCVPKSRCVVGIRVQWPPLATDPTYHPSAHDPSVPATDHRDRQPVRAGRSLRVDRRGAGVRIVLRALLGGASNTQAAWLERARSVSASVFPSSLHEPVVDATEPLYRGTPLGLLATTLLGLAMAIAVDLSNPAPISTSWLMGLLALSALRLIHELYWRQSQTRPDPIAFTRRSLVGLAANTLLWAALPWLAFGALAMEGRVTVMLATIGVASIEARAVSPMPRSALLQALLLALSGSAWLMVSSDAAGAAIGVMSLILLGTLASGIYFHHSAQRQVFLAAQENHRLAMIELEHREQIERLQKESIEVKGQMERAQAGLEQRIDERTAALEGRSRDLARQAVTDSLTGLPNRKGINDHLTELLAPMQALDYGGSELTLMFLDLDDFKEVNDQFGHLAGDQVLCVVADRLREALPRIGFAARWGGDEFIVVLPGMGRRLEQVKLLAEQLRAALCMPIRLDKGIVRIGCSIGVAVGPDNGRTPEQLVISADHAVYAAKSDPMGRVRMFDIELAKRAGRQHQISQALPAALEMGQLEVAYQPIVDGEGNATHVESLARWTHPKWGMVSPGEFIPLAEASGLIHTMGRWILRQACLDAARWPGATPPKVSVNVSAMQVSSGRLVAQVREALAASKLPANRLVIELTESQPMAGGSGVEQALSDLRKMGVTLAIDDFGTGYSSLSSLMKQPLSLVKVDRSFTQDIPGEGELLIKATVDVARCFGLEVVAEGVETPAQRSRLTALGVNYMQGYLFGRPMPNAEFVAWLGLRDTSNQPFALQA